MTTTPKLRLEEEKTILISSPQNHIIVDEVFTSTTTTGGRKPLTPEIRIKMSEQVDSLRQGGVTSPKIVIANEIVPRRTIKNEEEKRKEAADDLVVRFNSSKNKNQQIIIASPKNQDEKEEIVADKVKKNNITFEEDKTTHHNNDYAAAILQQNQKQHHLSFSKRIVSKNAKVKKSWANEDVSVENSTSGKSYKIKSGSDPIPEGSGEGGIFVYARRSAEDRSGRPLHAQFETIISYVNENILSKASPKSKMNKIRAFYVDNGVSGSVDASKRTGLSSLMRDVEELVFKSKTAGNFSTGIHIVTYDASRLARSIAVGSGIKSFFEKVGATLHLAQPRMIVEGASAELYFGLNLQIAASERTATIIRVKNAFKHHPSWDPRKSFGWKFTEAGKPPEIVAEEQEILKKMQEMYENEGLTVAEITKRIQSETGGRRSRRIKSPEELANSSEAQDAEEELVKWTGTEVTFLINRHKWKWGGGLTLEDLELEVDEARANGETLEAFLSRKAGMQYNGVKINRAMLRKYFIEEMPAWKASALERIRVWIRQEKHSVDDMSDMMNENIARPNGKRWPRQTVWRLIKEAERIEEKQKQQQQSISMKK